MRYGILGLGKTGRAAYKALLNHAKNLVCYDDNPDMLEKFAYDFGKYHIKSTLDPSWKNLDYIVLSPGIRSQPPNQHYIIQHSEEHNIKIISDIDLLYLSDPSKIFIGITGTNGKTTVTHMATHILQKAGRNFQACGNIGLPAATDNKHVEGYVIELSSFQLDIIHYLKLNIASITNLSTDHLDRYSNLDEYHRSKLKIFQISQGKNFLGISGSEVEKSIDLSHITLLEPKSNTFDTNFNSAQMICNNLGVTLKDSEEYIKDYLPLPYRMEYIGNIGNIRFYNDSKATNIHATISSISSFDHLILLAGGKSKEYNFSKLLLYKDRIRKIFLFGENAQEIFDQISQHISCHKLQNLDQAFSLAYSYSLNYCDKANIILSPMSSSLDQFKSFEERGKKFTLLSKQKIYGANYT